MSTHTPRTDAKCSDYAGPLSFVGDEQFLPADFARTLEHELAETNVKLAATEAVMEELKEMTTAVIWEGINKDHIQQISQLRAEAKAQGEHAVAMTELAQSWKREAETAQTERDRLQGEVDKLHAIKAVIDVPPQTIGDGTSAGPLSVFARGWNGYINTLREMHPAIQFREGCIDTSGRFHGDMTMADVNAYLRAVCAIHKSFCDEALTLCEDTGIAANIIAKMRDLRSAAIEEAMQARRA